MSQGQETNDLNRSNSTPLVFNPTKQLKNGIEGILHTEESQYHAISGLWGNGALPSGEYIVSKVYKLKPIKSKTEPYTGTSFPWIAKLDPQFKTDRTGLLIHPDGGVAGTRGCIGITDNDTQCFYDLFELSKQHKPLNLNVK